MNRRGFLAGILALGTAPAIVKADSIMRISSKIVTSHPLNAGSGFVDIPKVWKPEVCLSPVIRRDMIGAQPMFDHVTNLPISGHINEYKSTADYDGDGYVYVLRDPSDRRNWGFTDDEIMQEIIRLREPVPGREWHNDWITSSPLIGGQFGFYPESV